MSRHQAYFVGWIAVLLVVIVVTATQIGDPRELAAFRRDRQRLQTLTNISESVAAAARKKRLPAGLADLDSLGRHWKDPITGLAAPYRRKSKTTAEVQLTFELDTARLRRRGAECPDGIRPGAQWYAVPLPADRLTESSP